MAFPVPRPSRMRTPLAASMGSLGVHAEETAASITGTPTITSADASAAALIVCVSPSGGCASAAPELSWPLGALPLEARLGAPDASPVVLVDGCDVATLPLDE